MRPQISFIAGTGQSSSATWSRGRSNGFRKSLILPVLLTAIVVLLGLAINGPTALAQRGARASSTLAAAPGFDLTATERNFNLYYPTYLANGFFTTTTSLRGTDPTLSLMVGLMDYTPGDVPHPAAVPSWAEMDYFDGAAWLNATPVTAGNFQNYRQTLHMYDGVLSTQYDFVSGSHSTRVAVTTLASEDATHLGLTSMSITPDFTGTVRLRFTLRPRPEWTPRFPEARVSIDEYKKTVDEEEKKLRLADPMEAQRRAEWYPGYVKIESFGGSQAQRLIWITGRAVNGPQIAEAAAIGLPEGVTLTEDKLQESPQLVSLEIALPVERGHTYTFTKYVAVSREDWKGLKKNVSSSPKNWEELKSAVINWAQESRVEGIDSLLSKQESAWHRLWKSDILIEGDPRMQRIIHADLFTLYENSTVKTGWPMAACGLSLNYWGQIFWDNDSWDFPALVLLHPKRARSLAMFRYRTLPAAEAQAKAHGYRGAMYPWQADPQTGVDDTNYDFVPNGLREFHVDGDVAISQWQYYLATDDAAWLRSYGYPVIRETAEFLASRVTYNSKKDRYETRHVCSPEEAYNDVPNDSFTNAVIQKAMRVAVMAAGVVGQAPDPLWTEIAQKMYIPFSKKEQRHLDFDATFPHNQKTWMGSSISWLSYPDLDLAMSPEVRQNDFNFAVKSLGDHTSGPNSVNDMLTTMLSIEASELGDSADAYKWLKFNVLKPPFDVRSETADNNHLYILAVSSGFLENFLYGFTGLRLTDHGLTPVYPPVLPPGWKSVTIQGVHQHGQVFDLVVSRDRAGKVHLQRRPAGS